MQWLLLLWSMGSLCTGFSIAVCGSVVTACGLQNVGSVAVVHRLSCSVAVGSFQAGELNWYPLHCRVDS